jgi:single-strand DNA-binding protein
MRKGRPLLVEGRLKLDTWEDKNTHQKQSKLKVVLESFSFIDSKGTDAGPVPPSAEAPRRPAPPSPAKPPEAPEAAEGPGPEEDDVPF